MITFSLKIVEIIKETSDTVTICFKQPGLKKIAYQPGQYLTLIFRINGRRYIRPYSFSSAPGVDTTLNVTVKRVAQGIVSNHIIDKVNIGDVVEVMPPMGDFLIEWADFTTETHVVLWGVGSGITPLISIAKYLLHNKTNHVTLVYGNRDFESVIFAQQIEHLISKYPNFTVWHFHTRLKISSSNPYLIEGRIAPAKVIAVLTEIDKLNQSLHYICGPVGLKESVRTALQRSGIKEEHIFSEDFEVVKDPEDFKDVYTQSVEIIKDNTIKIVEVVKGKSILEAGLDSDIELPYSCQTGSCSICKAKLAVGNVKMVGVTKRPADLAENEYLLCCTYPLSDDVKIEAY